MEFYVTREVGTLDVAELIYQLYIRDANISSTMI